MEVAVLGSWDWSLRQSLMVVATFLGEKINTNGIILDCSYLLLAKCSCFMCYRFQDYTNSPASA